MLLQEAKGRSVTLLVHLHFTVIASSIGGGSSFV